MDPGDYSYKSLNLSPELEFAQYPVVLTHNFKMRASFFDCVYLLVQEYIQWKVLYYGVSIASSRSVPERLVPELGLGIRQVVLLEVKGSVEDHLSAGSRAIAVLGPLDLVLGPHGVGVASQDEGHEVLLHHDGDSGVDSGGAAAGSTGTTGGRATGAGGSGCRSSSGGCGRV